MSIVILGSPLAGIAADEIIVLDQGKIAEREGKLDERRVAEILERSGKSANTGASEDVKKKGDVDEKTESGEGGGGCIRRRRCRVGFGARRGWWRGVGW